MHKFAEQFTRYCETNFDLNDSEYCNYQSLTACLIDCIYSLRTKYYKITIPVVERYAELYMNSDRFASGDTVTQLINRIDDCGGAKQFTKEVLKNNQKLGGKNCVLKGSVLYQLAKYLKLLRIDTLEDFRNFESPELLEIVIRSVKGIGDAGVNYLFMLAGDPNRCKPDVHIHHCIIDACGQDVSNDECQVLFQETISILKQSYPNLTVRGLDGVIWRKYQAK